MAKTTSLQPALSPVNGKPILLGFDGADMSSDSGLTLLREIERRNGLAGLLAPCLEDLRDPSKVHHGLDEIIRFRILMIAAGYEDGNDAADLRDDPAFKLALERDPETRATLCSQPTISRMENLADTRALIRMAHEMVRFYCASFAHAPRQIVLDIDDRPSLTCWVKQPVHPISNGCCAAIEWPLPTCLRCFSLRSRCFWHPACE